MSAIGKGDWATSRPWTPTRRRQACASSIAAISRACGSAAWTWGHTPTTAPTASGRWAAERPRPRGPENWRPLDGQPTQKQIRAWGQWVRSRPKAVRIVAERFDIWSLYRMKSTGQRVTIASFSEDGTLRVNVDPRYNLVTMGRSVFGIDPDDLEECELPGPDEPVGETLSPPEQLAYVNARRRKNGLEPLAELPRG